MKLAAAATSGVLTGSEKAELDQHLQECEPCRCVFREYQILAKDGFRMLAESYQDGKRSQAWRCIFTWRTAWAGALVASLTAGVAISVWQYGNRQAARAIVIQDSKSGRVAELLAAKKSADAAIAKQAGIIARLQAESSVKRLALGKLQQQFQILEKRIDEERLAARAELYDLAEAKAASEAQVNSLAWQRNQLNEQLQDARQRSERIKAELAALESERDKAFLQLAATEARLGELTAVNQEQKQRLRDNEQFLASDRDIRDLMTARNLYIADVFDVDSSSRTRKPFGRIFYTRGKSLLFYAFDLDRQPRVKDNSTFQVWGQKETAKGEVARPLDLGILYLDSESNRRWVLRFDDRLKLSEIDAVFVTVELHGGSPKPTGKPFLFAMLRKEANHP